MAALPSSFPPGGRTRRPPGCSSPRPRYRFRRTTPHNSLMLHFFEQLIALIWNRLRGRAGKAREEGGTLKCGFRMVDGQLTGRHIALSNTRRTMHVAVLGKTGTGKSSLLRY